MSLRAKIFGLEIYPKIDLAAQMQTTSEQNRGLFQFFPPSMLHKDTNLGVSF